MLRTSNRIRFAQSESAYLHFGLVFGVVDVPQYVWLGWIGLRCVAFGTVVPGGVRINGPA